MTNYQAVKKTYRMKKDINGDDIKGIRLDLKYLRDYRSGIINATTLTNTIRQGVYTYCWASRSLVYLNDVKVDMRGDLVFRNRASVTVEYEYGFVRPYTWGVWMKASGCLKIGKFLFMNESIALQMKFGLCPICGTWCNEEYGCECSCSGLEPYHNRTRTSKCPPNVAYRIGIEVEKEDLEVLSQLPSCAALHSHTGWLLETDGSLDGTGFELISPIMPLNTEWIKTEIHEHQLVGLIEASHSHRCGLHFNISCENLTNTKLMTRFIPLGYLFYAMYPYRRRSSYSKMMSANDYLGGARAAFYLKDFGVEIRIFPSPIGVKQLLWRIELVRLYLQTMSSFQDKSFPNIDSQQRLVERLQAGVTELVESILNGELHSHLLRLYDETKLTHLCERIYYYGESLDKLVFERPHLELTPYEKTETKEPREKELKIKSEIIIPKGVGVPHSRGTSRGMPSRCPFCGSRTCVPNGNCAMYNFNSDRIINRIINDHEGNADSYLMALVSNCSNCGQSCEDDYQIRDNDYTECANCGYSCTLDRLPFLRAISPILQERVDDVIRLSVRTENIEIPERRYVPPSESTL